MSSNCFKHDQSLLFPMLLLLVVAAVFSYDSALHQTKSNGRLHLYSPCLSLLLVWGGVISICFFWNWHYICSPINMGILSLDPKWRQIWSVKIMFYRLVLLTPLYQWQCVWLFGCAHLFALMRRVVTTWYRRYRSEDQGYIQSVIK